MIGEVSAAVNARVGAVAGGQVRLKSFDHDGARAALRPARSSQEVDATLTLFSPSRAACPALLAGRARSLVPRAEAAGSAECSGRCSAWPPPPSRFAGAPYAADQLLSCCRCCFRQRRFGDTC